MLRPSVEKSSNELLVAQQFEQVGLLLVLCSALRVKQELFDYGSKDLRT